MSLMFEPIKTDQAEYWDLFDAQGRFVRKMRRGDGFVPYDLYHMTVEIIATDFAGHVLVTQRDWAKRRDAGKWEFPAGSVISGETAVQAAIRELWEETGLTAQKIQKIQERRIPGMLRVAYLAYIPTLLSEKITLQEGETMDYRIVTINQWFEMIAGGLFSSNRTLLYGERFYSIVEEKVGNALPEPTTPKTNVPPKKKAVPKRLTVMEESEE